MSSLIAMASANSFEAACKGLLSSCSTVPSQLLMMLCGMLQAVHSQMPETRSAQNRVSEYRPPVIPGRLAHQKTMSSPSPAVPQGVHTSRPVTPPPGFALQAAVGAHPAQLQRSTGRPRGDNDLYNVSIQCCLCLMLLQVGSQD